MKCALYVPVHVGISTIQSPSNVIQWDIIIVRAIIHCVKLNTIYFNRIDCVAKCYLNASPTVSLAFNMGCCRSILCATNFSTITNHYVKSGAHKIQILLLNFPFASYSKRNAKKEIVDDLITISKVGSCENEEKKKQFPQKFFLKRFYWKLFKSFCQFTWCQIW